MFHLELSIAGEEKIERWVALLAGRFDDAELLDHAKRIAEMVTYDKFAVLVDAL